ncbi:MAG: rhodanese-like domain-containing protein [Candidatus Micrarchaeota archaeon]|nr:rhodanese-like domain-containing protein [Candidatus Micrarchaeota archaeon]
MDSDAETDVERLRKELKSNHPPSVVDIREPVELSAEPAMAGALELPMTQLMARMAELPMDKPIVLVCASGSRSLVAQRFLSARGYAVKSLAGGMAAWHAN